MLLCANCILIDRHAHTPRTLAVLKINRKHLTDLSEASISPLTFKMNLSNLVSAVRASPDKFSSTGRERPTPCASGILARSLFSLSAAWILFWSVQENPKLKCVPPSSSVYMAGNTALINRSPFSDKISQRVSHRKL